MTISADEQWVADARERNARSGSWERDAETIFQALKAQSRERMVDEAARPGCPVCAEHAPMLELPRYELLTDKPLLYCGQCYGFWAAGDSLARGVADPGTRTRHWNPCRLPAAAGVALAGSRRTTPAGSAAGRRLP